MKRFLIRILAFCLLAGCLFFLLCELIMLYPSPFEKMGYSKRWFKVYRIALKSENAIGSDTLYIGDSVGAQFFPYTEGENYMSTNGAILVPGQYMIAANTIASNPNLKAIVLVCSPLSLMTKFENNFTCNNFIKPFYKKSNFKHISDLLCEKIKLHPLTRFYQFGIVKILPFSDIQFIDYWKPRENPKGLLPDISIEYLKKLETLCKENNIKLHLVCGPIEDTFFKKNNNWSALRAQIVDEGLGDLFEGYFEGIQYLEIDYFVDDIHLKKEYISEYRTYLKNYITSLGARN